MSERKMSFPLYEALPKTISGQPDWDRYWDMVVKLPQEASEVLLALIVHYCDLNKKETSKYLRPLPSNQGTAVDLKVLPEQLQAIIVNYLDQF
jgi:hypothetical protein